MSIGVVDTPLCSAPVSRWQKRKQKRAAKKLAAQAVEIPALRVVIPERPALA